MIVVITGSRTWKNRGPIEALIKGLGDTHTYYFGDCPTGADEIAKKTCESLHYRHYPWKAPWDKMGRAAGPHRNAAMVKQATVVSTNTGEPVVCFAFRDEGVSDGTDDCVYQANLAGIPTYVMRKMPDLAETGYMVPGINFNRKVKGK